MKVGALSILLSLFFVASSAFADKRVSICARYQLAPLEPWNTPPGVKYYPPIGHPPLGGWSKGYRVEASVMKGSELNRATKSYDYKSYSTYAVIFWAKDQGTIIKLNRPLDPVAQEGEDRRGVSWTIKEMVSGSRCPLRPGS